MAHIQNTQSDGGIVVVNNMRAGGKETWGVVFRVNASVNGAVLNARGAVGVVVLLMFMHVGAILLTPFILDKGFLPKH